MAQNFNFPPLMTIVDCFIYEKFNEIRLSDEWQKFDEKEREEIMEQWSEFNIQKDGEF